MDHAPESTAASPPQVDAPSVASPAPEAASSALARMVLSDHAGGVGLRALPRLANPGAVLALQQAAGNHATVRALGRAPAAQTAGKTPADLKRELTGARRAAYDALRTVMERHKALKDKGKERTQTEQTEFKRVAKELAELDEKVDELDGELALLTSPVATSELNALYARHGVATTSAKTTETTTGGWTGNEEGTSLVKQGAASTTSELKDGKATTSSKSGSTEVDLAAGSVKKSKTETTETVSGANTVKQEKVDSVSADLSDLSVTMSSGDTTTETGDKKSSTTNTVEGKVGAGGASVRDSKVTVTDDKLTGKDTTYGATRKDGVVSVGASTTTSEGKAKDGKLDTGTETTVGGNATVIAGPDRVGLGSNANFESKRQRGGGRSDTISGSTSRYATVSVTPTDDDPPQYDLVLTLHLGVAGKLGHKDKGGSVSVNASVNASASVEAKFAHRLSEAEKDEYLAQMKGAEAGGKGSGKNPELTILATANRNGLEAARGMLDKLQATVTANAESAALMPEGDSVEVTGTITGGLSGGVDVKGGFVGGGVEAGAGESKAATLKIAKRDGKVEVTKQVVVDKDSTAGGKLTAGVGSMGITGDDATSETSAVKFTLDPNDPEFKQRFAAVRAANSMREVRELAKLYPGITEVTNSASVSEGETTKIGLGPGTLDIGSKAKQGRTDKDTATGRETELTGSNTVGSGVTVGDLPRVGGAAEEKATAKIKGGKVSVDVSETHSQTDLGKSAANLAEALDKDKIGLATGGAKVMDEAVDVKGITLDETALDALVQLAKDKAKWDKAGMHPRLIDDWRAVRRMVVDSGGDRAVVAEALTYFLGQKGDGRYEVVQHAIRPPGGSSTTGGRYEFPEGMGSLKAAYDELVVEDPLAEVDRLVKEGDTGKAAAAAQKALTKLERLHASFQEQQAKITNKAARAEMLGRIVDRKRAVRIRLAQLGGSPTGDDGKARDKAEYDELLAMFKANRAGEERIYADIRATYHGTYFGFGDRDKLPDSSELRDNSLRRDQLRELYTHWLPRIERARQIAQQHGLDMKLLDAEAPNRAAYDRAMAKQKP
jgi:hypothetical protein